VIVRSLRPYAFLAVLGLVACASSHVLVGKARPPISPSQVQIYLHPPATKYEEVAVLDSNSSHSFSFTAQGKTDAVIARLKKEAAKLGANGVVLENIGDQEAGAVGSGIGTASGNAMGATGIGLGGFGAMYMKSGSGMAIYVPPN